MVLHIQSIKCIDVLKYTNEQKTFLLKWNMARLTQIKVMFTYRWREEITLQKQVERLGEMIGVNLAEKWRKRTLYLNFACLGLPGHFFPMKTKSMNLRSMIIVALIKRTYSFLASRSRKTRERRVYSASSLIFLELHFMARKSLKRLFCPCVRWSKSWSEDENRF